MRSTRAATDEWNEESLPALHGFLIRAVFPDKSDNFWVKWLVEIVVE
ncbi:MAG: molybdopterin-dependent oxidoreductase [Thermoleophilia bacterium]|nr:molybdopterin-dependent oxidoreductase [Thermoleophilia bacterium]